MSESAAKFKLFFLPPLHQLARVDTLQAAGAEDKPLLGSKLSADSGAKTRLGFSAKLGPSNKVHSLGLASCDKSQGAGDGVPRRTFLPLLATYFVIPLAHKFRSFVAYMSPPSTSA